MMLSRFVPYLIALVFVTTQVQGVSAQPINIGQDYSVEFLGVSYTSETSTFSYRFCRNQGMNEDSFEHVIFQQPSCEGEYSMQALSPNSGEITFDENLYLYGALWRNSQLELGQGDCAELAFTMNEPLQVGEIDIGVKIGSCGVEGQRCPRATIPGPSCDIFQQAEIPTCAISGPNINIQCEKNPLPRSITGASFMPSSARTEGITYAWSSNCPRASFTSNSTPETALMLTPFGTDLQNIACNVQLTVTDTIGGGAATCFSQVTTTGCNFDCKGVWEGGAEFDKCGVCGGDNSTCTNCTQVNTNSLRAKIDGQALQQRNLLLRLASYIPKTSSNMARIRQIRQSASDLYMTTWRNVWITLPETSQSCTAQPFCTSISIQGQLSTLTGNFSSFLTQSNKAYAAVPRSPARKKALATKVLASQKALTSANLKLVSSFPVTSTSCN